MALDRLLDEGADNVKVERLAHDLGVTKGSFYWHFKDRSDLLWQIAAFWEERQRKYLQSLIDTNHQTPEERLKALFDFIEIKDNRHDIAMRLWARSADWVDDQVAEIDRLRLEYCESIFHDMGFNENAARLRAHLVYYYQVAEQTVSFKEPDNLRLLRFNLLTNKD